MHVGPTLLGPAPRTRAEEALPLTDPQGHLGAVSLPVERVQMLQALFPGVSATPPPAATNLLQESRERRALAQQGCRVCLWCEYTLSNLWPEMEDSLETCFTCGLVSSRQGDKRMRNVKQ